MNRNRIILFLALALALPALYAAEPVPSEISSRLMEMRDTGENTVTVFSGNVVFTGTNLRITCDRLEIVSVRLGERDNRLVAESNRFRSLVATGNVEILQIDSNRKASCGRAEILPGEERITLSENPMIVDMDANGNAVFTWIGDELLLLRGEGRVQGRNIRVLGPAVPDLGYEPEPNPAEGP